jgi:hypothetical protein
VGWAVREDRCVSEGEGVMDAEGGLRKPVGLFSRRGGVCGPSGDDSLVFFPPPLFSFFSFPAIATISRVRAFTPQLSNHTQAYLLTGESPFHSSAHEVLTAVFSWYPSPRGK